MTAIEIVLAGRASGVVGIGAASHAEFVGVVTAHVLHGNAVFQRLAAIASLNAIDPANGRRHTEKAGGYLVTGELVVGRRVRYICDNAG